MAQENIVLRAKDRFQQLTTGKWPELYSLRACGVILIVLYHFWGLASAPIIAEQVSSLRIDFTGLFRLGALGTTIVFVLAGFFNHLSFERAHLAHRPLPAYLPFVKRRLIRTLPLYYASLTATILLAGGLEWLRQPYCGTETLLSLLFLHPLVDQTCGLIGPTWAVEAVVQFYVLMPLLAYLLLGKRWRISLPILMFTVLAYRWHIGQPDLGISWREYQLLPRLDHFLIGMMAAKFVARIEVGVLDVDRFGGKARVGAGAGVVALLLGAGACLAMANEWYAPGNAAWLFTRMIFSLAVAFGIVFLLYARKTVIHQLAYQHAIVWLGLAGYSAFMWHTVIGLLFSRVAVYSNLIPPDRLKVLLTLGIGVTLLVTVLSFIILELPFFSRQSRSKAQTVTENDVTVPQRL